MKRQTAINAFGSVATLAHALGVSRQAIYQWPDDLPIDQADRIRGAVIRLGIPLEKLGGDETATDSQKEAA